MSHSITSPRIRPMRIAFYRWVNQLKLPPQPPNTAIDLHSGRVMFNGKSKSHEDDLHRADIACRRQYIMDTQEGFKFLRSEIRMERYPRTHYAQYPNKISNKKLMPHVRITSIPDDRLLDLLDDPRALWAKEGYKSLMRTFIREWHKSGRRVFP